MDGVGEDDRGRRWRFVEGQPRTWRREAISDYLKGTLGDLGDLPGLSSKASGASWMLRRATVGSLGAVFVSIPATVAVWGPFWEILGCIGAISCRPRCPCGRLGTLPGRYWKQKIYT